MKLTRKKTIALHREHWDWIYRHPTKEKEDWPRFKHNGGDIPRPLNDCFLCEYVLDELNRISCSLCPIEWGNGKKCFNKGTAFDEWSLATTSTWQESKKWAKIVRDLPERKENA